jgi:hypothetical protein
MRDETHCSSIVSLISVVAVWRPLKGVRAKLQTKLHSFYPSKPSRAALPEGCLGRRSLLKATASLDIIEPNMLRIGDGPRTLNQRSPHSSGFQTL